MTSLPSKEIFLKDYRAPAFLLPKTHLHFHLGEEFTVVEAVLSVMRNGDHHEALELHGQELELLTVMIDGRELSNAEFSVSEHGLTIASVPDAFELRTEVQIKPQNNTSLEGLYKSSNMFCTQCEAEGFRKITYYLDRPDVLSEFTTVITGNEALYPVLLSNGNKVLSEPLDDGMLRVTWHDPFPKPSYLFALVAGQLSCVTGSFTTCSGRDVAIQLFVEEKDLDKCDHAIASLKAAMLWDEEVFGREYDLDVYMIVAVDDFNMGAMENKGLNIFNTSCVLANPQTTDDAGFQRVEAVVAHEYFHNWSGNRVTCRDWFQLSLKEGFTVFRDAEFSSDMNSRTVKRVEDVLVLQNHQFPEDASPMAHPVQPPSFIEISNFYTLTIYEKGAEVVRMIHTLLGKEQFRKGSDLYFSRHDGQAVTIEDFVAAMADVSGRDFTQFMNWYRQAGTPTVEVSSDYSDNGEYTLHFTQHSPSTPEASSEEKLPLLIPIRCSLLGEAGSLRLVSPTIDFQESSDNTEVVLELHQKEQSFTFTGLPEKPVPALLKDFSAPVKLHYPYENEDLLRILSVEEDGYSKWNAGQLLAHRSIDEWRENNSSGTQALLIEGYSRLLNNTQLDPAMVSLILTLPSEVALGERQTTILVEQNHKARTALIEQLVTALESQFADVYHRCHRALDGLGDDVSASSMALRGLKNTCLFYLSKSRHEEYHRLCVQQFSQGVNMTEVYAALQCLVNSPYESLAQEKEGALQRFYEKWQAEALVVNKWFVVQATAVQGDTLQHVKTLYEHPAFDIKNPNKVRSLISSFSANMTHFHQASGAGYEFLTDQIVELNSINPQIASRLVTPLTKWRRHDVVRQPLMKQQLSRILQTPALSPDVYEIVSKSLL